MNKLLSEFNKPSFDDWKNQLIKNLKGSPESDLSTFDEIEEIDYSCYQHQETTNHIPEYRVSIADSNEWLNFGLISFLNEESSNAKALHLLNSGADALRFDLGQNVVDFKKLTNGIELEYIHTRFCIQTIEQFKSFQESFSKDQKKFISLEIDLLGNENLAENQSEILKNAGNQSFLVANGYAVQQCGANSWQEIAFCLSTAHEYLLLLTENGFNISDAAKCISFNVGVGSNYFMEISKIRVLKQLWTKILLSYDSNLRIDTMNIFGIVGFTNKSLKDPYTNLLRQTTEAMSLISAGITGIIIHSYAAKSSNSDDALAERMALNIPLILKEESYLHAVQDPQGGSYTVKMLCDVIANKAWNYFQELDSLGGIFSIEAKEKLKNDVRLTAEKRIQSLNDKSSPIIGVSIFQNPDSESNEWLESEKYLGMESLILEKTFKVTVT